MVGLPEFLGARRPLRFLPATSISQGAILFALHVRGRPPLLDPRAHSPACLERCLALHAGCKQTKDTVVYDPFFHDMPKFFGMPFKQLLAEKHPTAWVEFECGAIEEDELFANFFQDGRAFDGDALKKLMVSKGLV